MPRIRSGKSVLARTEIGPVVLSLAVAILNVACCLGQDAPDWQIAAGGKKSFEVASVKPATSVFRPSFPLDDSDAFRATGNRFHAAGPLLRYIQFAYKLQYTPEQRESMLAHLPKWVADDPFDIDARAEGTATKDQFRLMMQSLLADRFKLAVHFDTQEASVLFLRMVKPGKMGPKLRPHADGPPCAAGDSDVFPTECEVYGLFNRGGQLKLGSRNTTMALLARRLANPGFGLSRPVLDRTGITERVDFTIECAEERNSQPASMDTDAPDLGGPSFLQALRNQLGLKLEPGRDHIPILIVDHVERPSEN